MLGWVALITFLFPLIYAISSHRKNKRERKRRLELIEKKLAEKEREATKLD